MILSVGCEPVRELIPVTGVVYFKGKPLTSGSIMFQSSHGQPARGSIQPDGTFELSVHGFGKGAFPGKNQVRVTAFQDAIQNEGEEPLLGKSLLPSKYSMFSTSGIEVEVVEGNSERIEIQLSAD